MQSDPESTSTTPSEARAIEVARDLRQPLAELARAFGQPPARIVNQALAEYLERRLRPDRDTSGSTSSYVEMTAREDQDDLF